MMQDQQENKLRVFYREILTETRAFIELFYKIEDNFLEDKDAEHVSRLNPNWTIWQIIAPGEEEIFKLFVAIPPTYPDKPPKFYLSEEQFLKFGKTPHVDKNREVCTRDNAVVVLNDLLPGEALQKLLEIAVYNIDAGLRGELALDFEDEFLAYWNDEGEMQVLLICTPEEKPVQFRGYSLSNTLFDSSYLIAPSKSYATEWINKLDVMVDLREEAEVLCLQLTSIPKTLPSRNRDIIELLQGGDAKTRFSFNSFRGNIILACILHGKDQIYLLWAHVRTHMKGFRSKKGVVPLGISTRGTKAERIVKFRVKRFDRERLVRRAIDVGVAIREDFDLVIAGCGSVGSTLVMLLAKSGCQRFTLIDPDDLTEENIARHLCGCHELTTVKNKVEAVKKTVERHLPFVSCHILAKDILEVLITEPQIFNNSKLVIFATANMGAERRANQFFHSEIQRPVVYLWLEPFGVAGHVLYISPEQGGCYQCCFDENGDFRFAVAEKGQNLTRREAGCQVTFTPYGAADLEMFCAIACKEIIRISERFPEQSQLTTWIGDKEQFQSAGHKIVDGYAAHESYSLHTREIIKQSTCEICKRKK